jgi:hypothetical protein
MHELEEDIVELMIKRTYDMCGIFGGKVKVYLNGSRLGINSWSEYVGMFLKGEGEGAVKVVDPKMNGERWQVVMGISDG